MHVGEYMRTMSRWRGGAGLVVPALVTVVTMGGLALADAGAGSHGTNAAAPAGLGPYSAIRIIDDPAISEVMVGDMDDDGRADVLTVSSSERRVAWWDTISFSRNDVTAGTHPVEMASPGDFNGDGCEDVLTFEPSTRLLRIWRNGRSGGSCTGAFTLVDQLMLTTGPFQHVTAGELTGDGLADYLMAEADSVSPPPDFLFAGNSGGALAGFSFYMGGFNQGAKRLKIADIDGDGCPDVAGVTGAEVAWWPRRKVGSVCVASPPPTASFADRSIIGTADLPGGTFVDAAVADLDGDGLPDVAALLNYVPEPESGDVHSRVYAWLNLGGGSFDEPETLWDTYLGGPGPDPDPDPGEGPDSAWRSLDAGDLDGDGDADLALAGTGSGVWVLLNGASPWGTATPTPDETPVYTPTAPPSPEATATGDPTPTTTDEPTTASPSPTHTSTPVSGTATPSPTADSTADPTLTPPCTPLADVGLVASAGNAVEARLLADALDGHAAAWQAATGNTLVHQIHVFDGGETYAEWLAERLAGGFREGGFCGARFVAVVGDNDLSRHAGSLANLRPLIESTPPLPEFLDYAWSQVHLPDRSGDPYALPWLRDGCSESYRNLALVEEAGDPGAAYDLLRWLVSEPGQRANYESRHAGTGARLAFPTLRQPYDSGWSEGGGTLDCRTVPPVEAPDPVLVAEAIQQAVRTAAKLAAVLEEDFRISRYSYGPDTDNVVYDTVDRPRGAGFLASSAVALTQKEPMREEAAEAYMAGAGLVVGQISFYAPGGMAVTPTIAPPTPTAGPTRTDGDGIIWLPAVLDTAAFLPTVPGAGSPFQSYAVMWRTEGGAPRAWLVRPDGSLADGAAVARDLGLPGDAIEFEAVVEEPEPRLGAAVWAEAGSKKHCWGVDGLRWCLKKK